MRTVVVATAGHVDHGKSALVRALTGVDPDRLPEEKRREMTIELGYAHLALTDESEIDLVDVPGHDRLVGNMLVGAGEVDAAMLVVAADQGVEAQTIEHVRILNLLGVRHAVIAVTKCDRRPADNNWWTSMRESLQSLTTGTSLHSATIVRVSSVTGEGLDALRAALAGLRDRVLTGSDSIPRRITGSPRLAIDRVFTVRGRGSVVTGTLRGGAIRVGDVLRLEPSGDQLRVRELQIHGATVEEASGSLRLALNFASTTADVRRGMVLCSGLGVSAADLVLVRIVQPTADPSAKTLKNGATLSFHTGTAHLAATLAGARWMSDGSLVALLRLDRPAAVAAGDRFILRVPSPPSTIAGGRILDPHPPSRLPRTVSEERLTALAFASRPGDHLLALVELHRAVPTHAAEGVAAGLGDPTAIGELDRAKLRAGQLYLSRSLAARCQADAVAFVRLREHHDPLAGGMPLGELRQRVATALGTSTTASLPDRLLAADALLENLVSRAVVYRSNDRISASPGQPAVTETVREAMRRLEVALDTATPPFLTDAARDARCSPEAVRLLESSGRIVTIDRNLAYAAASYEKMKVLALRLATHGPLTPAAFRDASGTSRKYAVAILETLNDTGHLRRTPAGHLLRRSGSDA